MPSQDLDARLRAYGDERHFRGKTIERWLALQDEDAAALLELAESLRLGENQLRDLWLWAEEVAWRDGCSVATVLATPELRRALRQQGGRAETLKAYKAALRRMRFPGLVAREQQLAQLVADLDLPATVAVQWPAFLEGDTLRLTFASTSAAELRATIAAMGEAVERDACDEIFALLGGDGG